MQNLLTDCYSNLNHKQNEDPYAFGSTDMRNSFAFEERQKPSDDMEAIYGIIEEQEEEDFKDMVANNLVEFEYGLYQ